MTTDAVIVVCMSITGKQVKVDETWSVAFTEVDSIEHVHESIDFH